MLFGLTAAPYWIKEPPSQLYAPGETVKLHCHADGIPSPTISWTINGIPLSGQHIKQTIRVSTHDLGPCGCADSIFYSNRQGLQTFSDNERGSNTKGCRPGRHCHLSVPGLQQAWDHHHQHQRLCHWWVFVLSLIKQSCGCRSLCVSFLFVCVVAELPPQILTEDGITNTFTEGQKAVLECETFGSPKPEVTWWDTTIVLWCNIFQCLIWSIFPVNKFHGGVIIA